MPKSVDTSVLVLPDGRAVGTGLTLLGGSVASPPDYGRIRWIRQTDGSVIADIYGTETGGIEHLTMSSYNPEGGWRASLDLNTDNAGASHAEVRANALGASGTATAMILNDLQQSDFLQLDTTGTLRLKRGKTRCTMSGSFTPGAYSYSAIAHGAPSAPLTAMGAIISPGGSIGAGNVPMGMQAVDATNITVWFFNQSAFNLSGGTADVGWAVIY